MRPFRPVSATLAKLCEPGGGITCPLLSTSLVRSGGNGGPRRY